MATRKIKRLLIANRSEIACRIMRTAREMGIETVAVYSDADAQAMHVTAADSAQALGGRDPSESYLRGDKIIECAQRAGADGVHPGYGFLSENAAFARAVTDAGLIFVGPSPESIEEMGDKIRARMFAAKHGIPLLPSTDETDAAAANKIGFPVLVKAAAGGGGRGMRVVDSADGLADAVAAATREAAGAFGDGRVYLEKLIERPRHIEFQVFGDGEGGAIHLGERECSIQRRHQKVIEETPSTAIGAATRAAMGKAAGALTAALAYRGAGTVEFIVDPAGAFYFLEMNTRLQVEHAITEMTTQTDLVRMQLETACGGALPQTPSARGHAIECRIYAEDPAAGFMPTSGRVLLVNHPTGPGVRVDSALFDGLDMPIEYDPMLAKIVAWAPDRKQAIARMIGALESFVLLGVTNNTAFLIDVLADDAFSSGNYSTATLQERFSQWAPEASVVLHTAAAALSALVAAGRADSGTRGATSSAASAMNLFADPWKTLGAWRLGGHPANRKSDT